MKSKETDGLNILTEGRNPSIAEIIQKGGRNPSLTATQTTVAVSRPTPPPAPPSAKKN